MFFNYFREYIILKAIEHVMFVFASLLHQELLFEKDFECFFLRNKLFVFAKLLHQNLTI